MKLSLKCEHVFITRERICFYVLKAIMDNIKQITPIIVFLGCHSYYGKSPFFDIFNLNRCFYLNNIIFDDNKHNILFDDNKYETI